MKYLCLAYGDRAALEALTPTEREALRARLEAHEADLRATGQVVDSRSLEWAAASIRPRGGAPVVTDGPFLETKEQVGGLVMLEARDLNEAVRVASLHPAAHLGDDLGCGVEVRPIERPQPLDARAAEAAPATFLFLAYGQREPMERLSPDDLAALGAACQAHDAALRATGRLVQGFSLTWDALSILRARAGPRAAGARAAPPRAEAGRPGP
ncbi:MAG: hypothetical protein KF878_04885 [Planctomycetes bacterium]|nr:hypothetical protein [Planctomycetota bacterium]